MERRVSLEILGSWHCPRHTNSELLWAPSHHCWDWLVLAVRTSPRLWQFTDVCSLSRPLLWYLDYVYPYTRVSNSYELPDHQSCFRKLTCQCSCLNIPSADMSGSWYLYIYLPMVHHLTHEHTRPHTRDHRGGTEDKWAHTPPRLGAEACSCLASSFEGDHMKVLF